MILRDSDSDSESSVRLRPADITASAFALGEFFDVLDVLYLERDGTTPAIRRNHSLRYSEGLCSDEAHLQNDGWVVTDLWPSCASGAFRP